MGNSERVRVLLTRRGVVVDVLPVTRVRTNGLGYRAKVIRNEGFFLDFKEVGEGEEWNSIREKLETMI